MKAMLAAALALSGCGQLLNQESEFCPAKYRLSKVSYGPRSADEQVQMVDDCLRAYGTRISKGHSADRDAAFAAIKYCGSYSWGGQNGEPENEKEERDMALYVIVSARAFDCPIPAERKTDGTL